MIILVESSVAAKNDEGIITLLSRALADIRKVSEEHRSEIAQLVTKIQSASPEEVKRMILAAGQNHGVSEYELKAASMSESLDEGWWTSTIGYVASNYKKIFSAGAWAIATVLFWIGLRFTAIQVIYPVEVIKLLLLPLYIIASGGVLIGLERWMLSWKSSVAKGPQHLPGQAVPAAIALAAPEIKKESLQEDFKANYDISDYLKDIQFGPLLTAEEERDLIRKAQQGDKAAHDLLINKNLRLVVAIAKRYRSYGVPWSDLIQEGNIGLLMAVKKFDLSKNYRFSTYATSWVRKMVLKAVAREINLKKEEAGIADPKDIENVVAPDEDLSPPDLKHIIDTALDSQTARILDLRYGLSSGAPKSLEEISRMIGVSRETIRQRIKTALSTLSKVVVGESFLDSSKSPIFEIAVKGLSDIYLPILMESLTTRDRLGLFYVLEYVYSHLKQHEWVEDEYDQLELAVERDLSSVLGDLFEFYRGVYTRWLEFHLGNTIYIAYILAQLNRPTSDTTGYSISYDEAKNEITYVEGGRPIVLQGVDFSRHPVPQDVEVLKSRVKQWGGGNLPQSFYTFDNLKVPVYVANFYYESRRHPGIVDDPTWCDHIISLHLVAWADDIPETIYEVYTKYLKSRQWQSLPLGHACSTLHILITTKHHSAKMGIADKEDELTIEYLDHLTNMYQRLPEHPTLGELAKIYHNWSLYI